MPRIFIPNRSHFFGMRFITLIAFPGSMASDETFLYGLGF
jgi:hypothetical protein